LRDKPKDVLFEIFNIDNKDITGEPLDIKKIHGKYLELEKN